MTYTMVSSSTDTEEIHSKRPAEVAGQGRITEVEDRYPSFVV